VVKLENLSMDLGFGKFVGLLSPSSFELVAQTHARLLESFHFWTEPRLLFSFPNPLLVILEKKYVGQVVDQKTRGNCIPTDSMKSSDDDSSLVHNIRTGTYVDLDKTNSAYWVG